MKLFKPNLFQTGKFHLHSHIDSTFKIECDALCNKDWNTLADIIHSKILFKSVFGIPRGGLKFAKTLQKYESSHSQNILIVDDVLTTGSSMEEYKEKLIKKNSFTSHWTTEIKGAVVFARRPCPKWIIPIFKMY